MNTMNTVYIYAIENTTNNKKYVGSTTNPSHRWLNHKSDLRLSTHRNRHLQKDWNAFGADNFKFEIIKEIKNDDNRFQQERAVIVENRSFTRDHGYNLTLPTENGGSIAFEETRIRMSAASKGKTYKSGKKASDESRANYRRAFKGLRKGGNGKTRVMHIPTNTAYDSIAIAMKELDLPRHSIANALQGKGIYRDNFERVS